MKRTLLGPDDMSDKMVLYEREEEEIEGFNEEYSRMGCAMDTLILKLRFSSYRFKINGDSESIRSFRPSVRCSKFE